MRPGAQKRTARRFGSIARASASDSGFEALERGDGVALDASGGTEQLSTGSPSSHTVHRPQLVVSQAQRTDATALLAQQCKEHGVGGNLNLDLTAVERKGKIDEFGSH